MSKSTLFFQYATIVLVAFGSATRVSAVCGSNAIGLANAQVGAVIVNNDCSVITLKDTGDFNVCGLYEDGSQVICREPFTPSTAHTSDGRDWGNCVASTERCSSGGATDQPIIQWCCPQL